MQIQFLKNTITNGEFVLCAKEKFIMIIKKVFQYVIKMISTQFKNFNNKKYLKIVVI